jgi:hypothetical protein
MSAIHIPFNVGTAFRDVFEMHPQCIIVNVETGWLVFQTKDDYNRWKLVNYNPPRTVVEMRARMRAAKKKQRNM